MKLYLDCCCYNRPFDEQTQIKVHLESEAILSIITKCKQNKNEIIGSAALDFEIESIADFEKKDKVKHFYEQTITKKVNYTDIVVKRVQELTKLTNIRTLDKFHLAIAENSGANILLTTDNKFERASLKLNLITRVINPLKYLLEILQDEGND